MDQICIAMGGTWDGSSCSMVLVIAKANCISSGGIWDAAAGKCIGGNANQNGTSCNGGIQAGNPVYH
ncbi:MAG: hypothetical protein ACXVCY_16770 [Pseudobdellovibrionaceae bacterium]